MPHEEHWSILWRPDNRPMREAKELVVEIGFSRSIEQAIERVVKKCCMDPEFARRYRRGRFYPFPIHATFSVEQALHGGP